MECVRGHSHMLHGIFSATGHVTSICKIRAAPLQATSGRTECGGVWFTSARSAGVHTSYSTAPSKRAIFSVARWALRRENTAVSRLVQGRLFDCDSDCAERANTCKRTCILEQLALQRTCQYIYGVHACMRSACMLVSPARRRSGLDSTGRGGAPAALDVVRSGRQELQSSASARTHPLDLFGN